MIVSNKRMVGTWMSSRLKTPYNELAEYVGLMTAGKLVAAVMYEKWNGVSIMCHIAVNGRLTREFLFAIFYYPFIYLGLKKIIAAIPCSNAKSRNLVEKFGFRLEGQILDAHPDGSLLIYTMNKEQCRFVGERYGQIVSTACA